MKPEDLKYPFLSQEKKAFIEDRVLFSGSKNTKDPSFVFPGWENPLLFGNANPVFIEYCSGNGLWIAEKAKENPGINWVAVELKFSRVRKIWAKIKNLALPNLIVVCGEAYLTTEAYFPTATVQEVFINFPDPWPKRRHARHRLIQKTFLDELDRILSKNGTLTFVTDDEGYSCETIETTMSHPQFTSLLPAPHFTNEHPGYGTSFFEDLWREQGKQIRYHFFQKAAI